MSRPPGTDGEGLAAGARGPEASAGADHRLHQSVSVNEVWAGLLVEELVRQGVGLFCLAPGSRSAPLALAVLRHPGARHLVHWDERATAFAALGWARATGRPAAWVTTSGTAVANGLPAVAEADAEGVPLLLLTADRPPELRATDANQTLGQPPLFASVARWAFDVPPPSADVDAAFVLTTAAQAVARALAPPGPVHLNLMFREPLAPAPDGTDVPALLAPLAAYLAGSDPFTRYTAPPAAPSAPDVQVLAQALGAEARGLMILGKTDRPEAAPAAARVARALGWPLLPDIASGARLGPPGPNAASHYDLALGSEAFADAHRPRAVLHVGGRATSKRLLGLIEASRPEVYAVVRPDALRSDPTHQVTHRVQGGLAETCHALADAIGGGREASAPSAWLRAWTEASEAVALALAYDLDGPCATLSEPFVARTVARETPAGWGLVAAASMPVRDLDAFAAGSGPALRVTANRGASGIDGTLATAHGFARGLGAPATLLVGDLALLYDVGALALLRDGPPVVVVVVNNDGGGIFHFLPAAEALGPDVFEPLFGTPHGLGFEDAARMFGLPYVRPGTAEAFTEAYRRACAGGQSALIEVRTDRAANRALHRQLAVCVASALEGALR